MDEISRGIRFMKMLKQIRETVKQNVEGQFKGMHVTGPQGMLLGTLAHYGEMKISDLSEKLGLSNSTVSGIVDRLEKQDLVERIRSVKDRRVVYVNVTSKFKETSQERFQQIEKIFEEIMSKGTPEEIDTILKGLETLEKLMERQ